MRTNKIYTKKFQPFALKRKFELNKYVCRTFPVSIHREKYGCNVIVAQCAFLLNRGQKSDSLILSSDLVVQFATVWLFVYYLYLFCSFTICIVLHFILLFFSFKLRLYFSAWLYYFTTLVGTGCYVSVPYCLNMLMD